jgi:hypothetical protein
MTSVNTSLKHALHAAKPVSRYHQPIKAVLHPCSDYQSQLKTFASLEPYRSKEIFFSTLATSLKAFSVPAKREVPSIDFIIV